jgi:flavin-dependent dehydrogenase
MEELTVDHRGRVTGIRGRQGTAHSTVDNARLVVGADGKGSTVARAVRARRYRTRPPATLACYGYWSGVPLEHGELYQRPGLAAAAFPTNDGLTMVYLAAAVGELAAFRADAEDRYLAGLDRCGDLGQRVRAGRRVERLRVAPDLPAGFRVPHGPGWALVGDAAYHKDPITANGISDAFRDAASLSDAIAAGLDRVTPLDEALAAHEAKRDAQCFPELQGVLEAVSFGPLPEQHRHLRAALRNNQAGADAFVSMFAGALSPQEFFAPENMQRMMRAS